jgi:glycosyltransferase involved in cell wall biosynthesis
MTKAHILIAAQNASTRFGGEAILPLHYFRVLKARGYHVDLVTHERNRDDLKGFFGGDMGGIHLIPDTATHRLLWRFGRRMPHAIRSASTDPLMALVTDRQLRRTLRGLIDPTRPTVVHVPTPVSPRTPCGIHGLGVPVVIGPMNGGMNYPPGYEDMHSRAGRLMLWLGRLGSGLANRLVPGKRRAAALLVANPRSAAVLPSGGPAPTLLVENGVDLSLWPPPQERPARSPGDPFRLVFMGRMIDLKAIDITLQAVAQVRARGGDLRLDLLGDGVERRGLEKLSQSLGLSGAVTFHGFLPQVVCAEHMTRADALILNSVHECGGAVVLEAMARGLPVIAADWGGPADYLDDSCGRLVSPVPRAGFAGRLADAICELAADPALCARLGQAGLQRVHEDYDWEKKVDRMLAIYAGVLSGGGAASTAAAPAGVSA